MRAPIAKKDQTSRPARFPALSLHHKAGDVGDGPQGAEGVLSAGLLDEWTAMTPTCQSAALSSRLRYPNAYSDPASRQLMGTQNLVSLRLLFLLLSCQKWHHLSPRHQAPNANY